MTRPGRGCSTKLSGFRTFWMASMPAIDKVTLGQRFNRRESEMTIERLRQIVLDELACEPGINSASINVIEREGVVTLAGQVDC